MSDTFLTQNLSVELVSYQFGCPILVENGECPHLTQNLSVELVSYQFVCPILLENGECQVPTSPKTSL